MSKRKTLKAKILLFQSLKYLTLNRLIPACSLTAPYRSQCHLLTTGPHLCSQSHCMFTRESIRSLNYILQLIDTSGCQSNCVKNSRCQGKQHVLPATWYNYKNKQAWSNHRQGFRTELGNYMYMYLENAWKDTIVQRILAVWGVSTLCRVKTQKAWLPGCAIFTATKSLTWATKKERKNDKLITRSYLDLTCF